MKAKKVLMSLDAGTKLGHYEIRSKLGAGGMGEVYLARDTSELERTVALKFLPAELASDHKRMQRFIQEARTVSALNHPNILTIYEFGQADSVRFISMEYVDGVTLRDEIRERRLKLHDVLDIAVQIAAALNAAHEAGVVHRDIKPENVMIRRDHIVKVLDFGLAKLTMREATGESVAVDSEAGTKVLVHTEPGLVMGTASYMSPEQSQGSARVDHRTDIWSLGVVLYEMVAGRLPFEGKDIHRQIIAIQEQETSALSKFAEGVPERLEEIVLMALAKSADERYQTTKDLLIDLRNLKRKLDVDAEIERTIAPELRGTSGAPGVVSGAQPTPIQTATGTPAQPTSSAEYIVRGVRKHKVAFTAALLVLLLAVGGLSVWYFSHHSANAKQTESIAVLPFVNESGNPDNEYLSDGMTESLISSLSQIPNLSIKARSSVFRYKGKETDLPKIAQELNVQAILTGRVLQRGEQLILNLELVDAKTENVIWSEQYTRQQADLVSLQSEIARDVSRKLQTKLSGADERKVTKTYTADPEAYQLYLQGRYHWNKRTEAEIRKSIDYFNRAIARDPNYALAYAGLAEAYVVLPIYSNTPSGESFPKAKAAAQKALEIDDTLGEALLTLAVDKQNYDPAGAERDFQKAIALDPNNPTAHQWYGEFLGMEGRSDEGIAEMRRALELDPLSLIINKQLGTSLLYARRYDEAIAEEKKVLEMDANFVPAHWDLGWCYTKKGMYDEAIAEFQKTEALNNGGFYKRPGLAYALAKSGRRNEAQKILEEMKERQKREHVDPGDFAIIHAALGDKDEAFADLEKGRQENSPWIGYLKVDPALDDLRDDPRFQDLLRRVGPPK